MLTEGMTSSGSTEWQTPDEVFKPLNDLWDFTLDGAASHLNAKCDRYCTAEGTYRKVPEGYALLSEHDGLNFPWRSERVFLNPPWGDAITEFVRKARLESLRYGAKVVAILPARMDTAWMHDHVLGSATLRYWRGRPKFVDPEAEARKVAGLPARTAPPVGIVIATYR
jgi:site-specific DNA-methyltransferase (adenine-specific)